MSCNFGKYYMPEGSWGLDFRTLMMVGCGQIVNMVEGRGALQSGWVPVGGQS